MVLVIALGALSAWAIARTIIIISRDGYDFVPTKQFVGQDSSLNL